MRVNVARVWDDADYMKVRNMCDNNQGWREVYKKKGISVFSQSVPSNNFQMIKAVAKFPDVLPSVAYDVLHDSSYRSHWDRHMASQCFIGIINPNNDMGYYALSAIPPVRGRDFVMQRSWLDTGDEKLICGHSVYHQDYPPMKGYVRAVSILSAYLIRPLKEDGCQIIYLSHSDPKGTLPPWLVNYLTRVVAPKVVKKLHKACLSYTQWKQNNQPNFKPWIYPEQQSLEGTPIRNPPAQMLQQHNQKDEHLHDNCKIYGFSKNPPLFSPVFHLWRTAAQSRICQATAALPINYRYEAEYPRVDLTKCEPQEYEQEIIDESNKSPVSKSINDGDETE